MCIIAETPDPAVRRHPARLVLGIALPLALLVGVIVAARSATRSPARQPLPLGPVPAPAAQGPQCTALLPALPADLGDYASAELADPAPPGARAWQRAAAGEPIVLRCGLDRPAEFTAAAALQLVDGVQWFQVTQAGVPSSTWFAVDRGTYIALTLPPDTGPTPLQAVSDAIAHTLPAQPIDPAPLPG